MSCGSTTSSSEHQTFTIHARSPPRTWAIRVPSPFKWVFAVMRMEDRWQQRQSLLDLSDHLLRDISITRDQAEHEANKPFWR